MKVLNLCCGHGHGFEGWFASEDDFVGQNTRHDIACPLCADTTITRLPSAPRLNLSGARAPVATDASTPGRPERPAEATTADLQAMWLKTVRQVLKNTEDVGERFPEEARRIHYGEAAHRGIRGQASDDERAALAEEGIDVLQLLMPAGLKGPAH